MKRRKEREAFSKTLRSRLHLQGCIRPGDVHIVSVNARFGHYQIAIGPDRRENGQRSIEINGQIHHLFLSEHKLQPVPTQKQMEGNMRHTVIARDLAVHLVDPDGEGRHLAPANNGDSGLHAREYINLAGPEGEEMIGEAEHSRRMSLEAYRLIQEDILASLRTIAEESTEEAR